MKQFKGTNTVYDVVLVAGVVNYGLAVETNGRVFSLRFAAISTSEAPVPKPKVFNERMTQKSYAGDDQESYFGVNHDLVHIPVIKGSLSMSEFINLVKEQKLVEQLTDWVLAQYAAEGVITQDNLKDTTSAVTAAIQKAVPELKFVFAVPKNIWHEPKTTDKPEPKAGD